MSKIYLTWDQVNKRAEQLAISIKFLVPQGCNLYGVPRGGSCAALLVLPFLKRLDPAWNLVDEPKNADAFVDDIIDSGNTMRHFRTCHKMTRFFALYDKLNDAANVPEGWLVFPWETERSEDNSVVGTITNRLRENNRPFKANDNISTYIYCGEMEALQEEVEKRAQALLDALIIDTANCHNTKDTAKRMAKMYCQEIFAGRYKAHPVVTDFPNAGNLDEAYTTGPIAVRSTCAHHMLPIAGKAWIGIIPGEKVIGLSKFNRIVEWVASRPQIQEELVIQIADAIEKLAQPKGLAVVIKATHSCMTCRGVKESDQATMNTCVLRGAFRDKPEARAEFFSLIR